MADPGVFDDSPSQLFPREHYLKLDSPIMSKDDSTSSGNPPAGQTHGSIDPNHWYNHWSFAAILGLSRNNRDSFRSFAEAKPETTKAGHSLIFKGSVGIDLLLEFLKGER